ncbi:hypothetical protein MSMTP_3118 [Methanosarcina sp. MTP4]|uniref:hypothetical protein n=1 Tax=Methanosarcina sp. MTP4 TaxID=1434100 RepID=UPI00061572F7|nr:hypothetical protein [Methanosarcina sp. MTP4]AKB26587.1 hypothetical protein MSMTP_3118 [Methanosarcina sp. MTP4]
MLGDLELDIVKKSFKWLSQQQISSLKELSRALSARAVWKRPNPYITRLIHEKEEASWNDSVRETARACSALATEGIVITASEKWLLSKKSGSSWNEEVYDTAYVLAALADMEVKDREGCRWLYENYGLSWEQVGTTSLIITALQKQDTLAKSTEFRAFIQERAEWVLSKRETDGGWKHISTSNLAVQALVLAGFKNEIEDSIRWLLENVRESGAWGNKEDDVNATSLTLITLGLYNQA